MGNSMAGVFWESIMHIASMGRTVYIPTFSHEIQLGKYTSPMDCME